MDRCTLWVKTVLDVAGVQAARDVPNLVRCHRVESRTKSHEHWLVGVAEVDDKLERIIASVSSQMLDYVKWSSQSHRHRGVPRDVHCPQER